MLEEGFLVLVLVFDLLDEGLFLLDDEGLVLELVELGLELCDEFLVRLFLLL